MTVENSWNGVTLEHDGDVAIIVVRDRVRLHDTDSSGRIFYGVAADWFNTATAEFMIALGFEPSGLVPRPMLPVVEASMSYHRPMKIGDRYATRGWIAETGRTSLTMAFEVRVDDVPSVTGLVTHVHLRDDGTPAPVPARLRAVARPSAATPPSATSG